MKILGLIPARGGSKGIPQKNIKLLNGKPLISYTIDVAQRCKRVSKLIVSSDDDDIINLAKSHGVEVPFKRPSRLSSDTTPSVDVVRHALMYFKDNGEDFDAVCLLQPTCPLKTAVFIDRSIELFMNNKADSLVSVQSVPHKYNPHWVFEPDDMGFLTLSTKEEKIISRRQDLPTAYHRDGIIYIIKSEVVMTKKVLLGDRISFIESPPEFNINIDTFEDWQRAEEALKLMSL